MSIADIVLDIDVNKKRHGTQWFVEGIVEDNVLVARLNVWNWENSLTD